MGIRPIPPIRPISPIISPMTIAQKQNLLVEEFSAFDNWQDKYEFIIEQGHELPKLSPDLKNADNLIRECQSKAWLYADLEHGSIHYYADSEAVIIKGLIALLVSVVTGHSPEEIAAADLFFIEKTGLSGHFSNRSTGLKAMVKRIKDYASSLQELTVNQSSPN
jgi:cysteine desulfuration protein SufE